MKSYQKWILISILLATNLVVQCKWENSLVLIGNIGQRGGGGGLFTQGIAAGKINASFYPHKNHITGSSLPNHS